SAVLCDLDALDTLPDREYRSGLGEMAKYAFLGVGDLATLSMEDAVAACVACKAAVVSADERDQGRRALLNYGHTLAHALETSGRYELRHGEAVAVGLVFAAHVAARLGRIGPPRVAEHEGLVAGYGLPARLPEGADPEDLLEVMARDKKRLRSGDAHLTMVLDGPGGLEVVEDVPRPEARAALDEVAA
ncbi:MAG: 3-dehydroquinate synthase family protein, partial [Acidimicrobiales bacterium]